MSFLIFFFFRLIRDKSTLEISISEYKEEMKLKNPAIISKKKAKILKAKGSKLSMNFYLIFLIFSSKSLIFFRFWSKKKVICGIRENFFDLASDLLIKN